MATTIELKVEGMTCDHCVNAVTNAITAVDGVSAADVRLDEHAATVEGDGFDVAAIVAAIEEEGYDASVA